MKINLGCGHKPLEGFVNIDVNPQVNPDLVLSIGKDPWPFEDNSVEQAAASHLIEHLDTDEFMHFWSELYRVMKPGAPVHIAFPHPRHDVFLTDPTHKKAVTLTTIGLFSNDFHREMGWIHTPFSRYLKVDFRLIEVNANLDERCKDLPREEIERLERCENNVIIEYHCLLAAMKPYSE